MNSVPTAPESPSAIRQNRIKSITIESDNGTILGTLINPEILRELQENIIKGEVQYLGIVYLLMQYIAGNEKIKTTISDERNPGSHKVINIKEVILSILPENTNEISHAIQQLRGLYQNPASFFRLKWFGDMIHLNPAAQEKTKTAVEVIMAD